MKTTFNPEYSALLNAQRGDFSIVSHVPVLPPASAAFQSTLCYLKNDGCFYRCRPVDGIWCWEKVTYGPLRQYILSVCWITVEYVFDDEVNTIKALIADFKRYGVYFEDMEEGSHGVSLLTAVRKTNEIITHVNRVCGVELELVNEGVELDSTTGDTCEELGTKLNRLISVVNPHAGAKLEHDKLANRITALEEAAGTRDSFRTLTADELAAGPQTGSVYFIKTDEGDYIEQSNITEFEVGTDYYISDMTPAELVIRLSKLEQAVAGYNQQFTDFNVTIRNITENVVPTLTNKVDGFDGRIGDVETATATIINTYIGWQRRGNDERSLIDRIIAVESAVKDSPVTLSELNEKIASLSTKHDTLVTKVNDMLTAQKTKDEAQDTERTALIATNNKYKTAFEAIAGIAVSDDMSFAELHDAVVAIVTAAKTVVA